MKVSVVVRVLAENKWHAYVRVTSEEFNKKTPYKGVTGHSVTYLPALSTRREREQSLDVLDVALDRAPTFQLQKPGVAWAEGSQELTSCPHLWPLPSPPSLPSPSASDADGSAGHRGPQGREQAQESGVGSGG